MRVCVRERPWAVEDTHTHTNQQGQINKYGQVFLPGLPQEVLWFPQRARLEWKGGAFVSPQF